MQDRAAGALPERPMAHKTADSLHIVYWKSLSARALQA